MFYINTQFNKDIYCGNCRELRRRMNNSFLEHNFIKYLIDQTEFKGNKLKQKIKSLIIFLR